MYVQVYTATVNIHTSIKNISKNALSCRDGYAKKHSNKMWVALCQQGKDGVKQESKLNIHSPIPTSFLHADCSISNEYKTNSSTKVNILHDFHACPSSWNLRPLRVYITSISRNTDLLARLFTEFGYGGLHIYQC